MLRYIVVGAALTVALGACGDDDGNTSNIADAAASIDADLSDAEPTTAACGISVPNFEPAPTVVFNDAAGEVLATITPDSSGLATLDDCASGTMITVAFQASGGALSDFNTFTYTGVEPGTTILLDQPELATITEATPITLASPGPGGAVTYSAGTGCDSSTTLTPGVLGNMGSKNASCAGLTPTNLAVLAVAENGPGAVVGFDYKLGVAIDALSTDFGTLDGWEDPTTATVELTNTPAGITAIDLGVAHLRDGVELYGNNVDVTPAEGTVNPTIPELPPVGFADQTGANGSIQFNAGGGVLFVRYSAPAAAFSVDFAGLLPRLSGVLISTPNRGRPAVTWAADGDMSSADFGFFITSWADTGGASHRAVIIAGDTASTSVQFPALPDPLAGFRPTADTTFNPAFAFFARMADRSYADILADGSLIPWLIPGNGIDNLLVPGEDTDVSINAID